MNKCRISSTFLRDIIQGVKGKPRNRKIRDFLERWNPTVHQNKLYHDGRLVVPYEDVPKVLKREAEENGMPLSRDGAYHYLRKKFIGFKKTHIMEWLKSVEQLQMIHKKPYVNSRPKKQDREGTVNHFMKGGNRLNLGVDLFFIPKEWSSYKYFFVAVLQRSGFTWIFPQSSKAAVRSLTNLRKVFSDCKKRFGQEPTGVSTDDGNEFKSVFDAYLRRKQIERRILSDRGKMCWWVEKRNSTFARIFAPMRQIHGFKKSLALTLEKVNNIRSRITRKAPVDWTPEDFTKHTRRYNRKIPKVPKRRKQPVYSTGQKVRHLMKAAMGKTAFYKSYEGMRSKKHQIWSKTIYEITGSKKLGHYLHYRVNNEWRPPYELQLIEHKVIRLEPPKEEVSTKRKKAKPKPKPKPKPVVAQVLRRSTRIRKKPKRFGQS